MLIILVAVWLNSFHRSEDSIELNWGEKCKVFSAVLRAGYSINVLFYILTHLPTHAHSRDASVVRH